MEPGPRKFGAATCRVGRTVQVPVRMRDRMREVSALYCPPEQRGQGFARELMHAVCAESDAANTVLMVHVEPFGDSDMTREQLATWYAEHFGFGPIQSEPLLMARMPGATPRMLATPTAQAAAAYR